MPRSFGLLLRMRMRFGLLFLLILRAITCPLSVYF
jgi:hypothetical protein